MRKGRFTILLCAVVLCATSFLTACHGTKGMNAFEIPEEFDDSREYTISFWAKNDTNKAQTDIYKKAIEDFEALYPNIHVEMKLYTDYGRIYNDVITNISTNTTPNVCVTYPDHIATYITGINIVVPLDKLMTDERFGLGSERIPFKSPKSDEIIPEYLEECKIGNAYYALPFMRSTEACYINKTYVEKLGYSVPDVLTWDWIWEVSEAATKKNANGTFALNNDNVMIPFIYKSTDNMMITYLKQANAGYSTDNGDVEIFNDTTKDFLLEIANHTGTGAFSTFKVSSYPANFLNAGQCIFAIDSTAGATWMGADAPLCDIDPSERIEFETVVRPVPQIDVSDIKMMSQGPSVCIFNKEDPQEVLASWLFMQYLLTDTVQAEYSMTEGYVPVTFNARECDEYKEYLALAGSDNVEHYQIKIDATTLLLENAANTFVTPVFNGSASVRNAASNIIESTVKSVRRGQEVTSDSIEEIFEENNNLYKLDQLNVVNNEKEELGPLPDVSVRLLVTLALSWVAIIAIAVFEYVKSKKKKD